MSKKIDNLEKKKVTSDQKIERFADLLDSIETTKDKKKHLWKEIYENAITDRQNASMLFTDAFTQMQSGTAEHISLGSTMAKYLERMNKSNEQILRLAELISKAEEQAAKIDPDDLFNQIQG